MSSRRSRGFTLVEMIIAMVIIGVGLAGVLAAFSTNVRSSADPMIHKQMLAIAEEMMEEILLKPYVDPGTAGTIAGCNRANADNISDYANYGQPVSQPVCDIDGTAVPALAGYGVTVAVDSAASLGGLASNVTKITVTVTRGGESLSLVGWRTNYGA